MAVLSKKKCDRPIRYYHTVQYDITTCSSQVQYRTSSTYFILGTCMNARIANLHDNARSAPVIYLSIYQYPAVKITAVTQNVVSTQLSHVYVVASSSIHTSSIFGTYLIDLLIPSWYMQYSNSCTSMYRPDRLADRIDSLYLSQILYESGKSRIQVSTSRSSTVLIVPISITIPDFCDMHACAQRKTA